ncbi:MAG: hypothetical protein EXR21_10400 [Flavobacteriaceae bacterium]|nr:hypothetical protein [Flavobacteriaceae bacterium]
MTKSTKIVLISVGIAVLGVLAYMGIKKWIKPTAPVLEPPNADDYKVGDPNVKKGGGGDGGTSSTSMFASLPDGQFTDGYLKTGSPSKLVWTLQEKLIALTQNKYITSGKPTGTWGQQTGKALASLGYDGAKLSKGEYGDIITNGWTKAQSVKNYNDKVASQKDATTASTAAAAGKKKFLANASVKAAMPIAAQGVLQNAKGEFAAASEHNKSFKANDHVGRVSNYSNDYAWTYVFPPTRPITPTGYKILYKIPTVQYINQQYTRSLDLDV